jgi:hypothetical protein
VVYYDTVSVSALNVDFRAFGASAFQTFDAGALVKADGDTLHAVVLRDQSNNNIPGAREIRLRSVCAGSGNAVSQTFSAGAVKDR